MQTTKQNIGKQVKLPISTAFGISLQGIRIRLNRALVTLSGVILGIAFLMSILATQLIDETTKAEQNLNQQVDLMMTVVRSEVGELPGKRLSLYKAGELNEADKKFISTLQSQLKSTKKNETAGELRVYGTEIKGATKVSTLEELGKDSSLLIIIGDGELSNKTILNSVVETMTQPVIVDTISNRAEFTISTYRYNSFFGDGTAEEINKAEMKQKAKQETFRRSWIVIISLLVTVIGITNALLMSVTERFKEIGTMKCLGALSSFIRQMFLIESALIGIAGSFLGALVGALFPMVTYGFTLGFGLVFSAMNYPMLLFMALLAIIAGTFLAIVAAIYPATVASKMVPAMALRSNV